MTYNTIAETQNYIVLDNYTKLSKVSEAPATYQSENALEREFIEDLVEQGYEYLPQLTTPKHSWQMCAGSCRTSTA